MTPSRFTSGTEMARRTAVATSPGEAPPNSSVSKPWLKLALAGAGASARAARTAASTMAWRNSGTGAACGVRVTMSVFPSGAQEQGWSISAERGTRASAWRGGAGAFGAGAVAGDAPGDDAFRVARGAGEGLCTGGWFGARADGSCVGAALRGVAHPVTAKAAANPIATTSLLAMRSSLSCVA